MSYEEKIERRLAELRRIANEYAEAKGRLATLEHYRKSKLAILMKKYQAMGHKTAAAQEREAYADPEYVEFLQGLGAATEKAEKLRYELELAKLGADLWRTQEATKRAEMKGYGL